MVFGFLAGDFFVIEFSNQANDLPVVRLSELVRLPSVQATFLLKAPIPIGRSALSSRWRLAILYRSTASWPPSVASVTEAPPSDGPNTRLPSARIV
jgi:hypothetical protein